MHKLKKIAKHFKPGRQEDAHEFMRYLVDGVHEVCLKGSEKKDIHTQRTTAVCVAFFPRELSLQDCCLSSAPSRYSVFGGFLQNTISCTRCGYESITHDATLDINLDIAKCSTLEKALRFFTAPEKLTRDNTYNCDGCKHKVKAVKRLSIHRAPAALSIQLKRFNSMSGWGGKINKMVTCVLSIVTRKFGFRHDSPAV